MAGHHPGARFGTIAPVTRPTLPSLRDQAGTRDAWLAERLAFVVPRLMAHHGIDAWVLVAREYNEDPVVATMLPATWLSARRRTILVFTDSGRSRAAIARYAVGDAFPAAWDPTAQPDQWAALAEHLERADPHAIALNVSDTFALADGLSHAEHQALVSALPDHLRSRLTAADGLAVGWLETRVAAEVDALGEACRVAHQMLRRGLSPEAIRAGTTTTNDLEWWLREEVRRTGLEVWFQPTASVQRAGDGQPGSFSTPPEAATITPGDLVHVDFGIVRLGLHTDQQQHAYVLRSEEAEAPPGLTAGVRRANQAQDLLMAEFAAGRTGNEILAAARKACAAAGLDATIYTHPLGVHGHAAGPTIGLWDQQDGVPGAGDYQMQRDTAYSIELSVAVAVPEWGGQQVRFMLEEDAFFDGASVRLLDGRQTDLWLVD